jgi:hypothetical protein
MRDRPHAGGVFLLDPGTITSFVPNPDHIHRTASRGVPPRGQDRKSRAGGELHLYGRNMDSFHIYDLDSALAPPRECRAQRKLAPPALAACLGPSGALAQDAQLPDVRSEVVVTATRVPRAGLDVPAAIDVVDARAIREDKPQVNLSECINRVPGIVVQNRQNYAQDLQVSSRGFGGRATFGVRGGAPHRRRHSRHHARRAGTGGHLRPVHGRAHRGPARSLREPLRQRVGRGRADLHRRWPAAAHGQRIVLRRSYDTWKLAVQGGGTSGNAQLHRRPLALRDRRLPRPQRRRAATS